MTLKTTFLSLLWSFVIYFLIGLDQANGNEIKDYIIKDHTGENICIGDLDCFLYGNEDITVEFNLVLDNPLTDLKFNIKMEGGNYTDNTRTLTHGYSVKACYDSDSSKLTLGTDCKANDIPVGTYPLSYGVFLPTFHDSAFLYIYTKKGFSAFRTLFAWN